MSISVKKASVLLADDHPAVIAQARLLLAADFEIVGAVSNGLNLLEAVPRLNPDTVILDITMPGLDGIEAARRLQLAGCRARVVFLTVHDDPDYRRAAMDAGGAGYVVKSRLASDLVTAISEVLAGRTFVSPTTRLEEGS